MRYLLLIIILAFQMATVMAQNHDTRSEAQEMNRRAEAAVKQLTSKAPMDSIALCRNIIDAVSYSLKSDEYDRMPQRNGQVKTRFVNQNKKRLLAYHHRLLAVGDYLLTHKQTEEAREAYVLYMNAAENRLLSGEQDDSGIAAYALAEISLERRNYKQADRYANIALAYDNSAQLAAEIKAQCMRAQMITPQDSAKYLAVINKLSCGS